MSSETNEPASAPAPMVVVSYRLPVVRDGSAWRRAPGGLVSALAPALAGTDAVWLGRDDSGALPLSGSVVDGLNVVPIRITNDERHDAVDGFCNRTLWPALHGLENVVEQKDEWWESYKRMNQRTANVVAERAGSHATVWIHDYQNFGVAQHLRARRPDLRIGLFCHTPWNARTLGGLQHAGELHESLFAHDLIGTQTDRDAVEVGRFLGRVDRLAPFPAIKTVPVGFDVQHWQRLQLDPAVQVAANRGNQLDINLAVGIDRIDYTKGLIPKMLAIARLLDSGVLSADSFHLIQVAVPSRTTIPTYQNVRDGLVHVVADINKRNPRADGRPVIDLRFEHHSPRGLAAILLAADLAIVTPLRDGMNLVALEAATINARRPFEMVLSRGAGAAEHLGRWSDLVDGGDVRSIACGIQDALARVHMQASADAHRRSALRGHAAAQLTTRRWVDGFMGALADSAAITSERDSQTDWSLRSSGQVTV